MIGGNCFRKAVRVGVKLVEFTAASKQWAGLSNNMYTLRMIFGLGVNPQVSRLRPHMYVSYM